MGYKARPSSPLSEQPLGHDLSAPTMVPSLSRYSACLEDQSELSKGREVIGCTSMCFVRFEGKDDYLGLSIAFQAQQL